jgi:hypothetical protein
MDTRITNRTISAIETISWVAITMVMGLILTIIAASIYASLGVSH